MNSTNLPPFSQPTDSHSDDLQAAHFDTLIDRLADTNEDDLLEATPENRYYAKATIQLDKHVIQIIEPTGNWGRFLSICGFISAGFIAMFMLCFVILLFVDDHSSTDLIVISTIIAVLATSITCTVILSSLFLRYANKLNNASQNFNTAHLVRALENQKSLFTTAGVIAILILIMYAIGFFTLMIRIKIGML